MARILFSFLGTALYRPATYSFTPTPGRTHHTRFFPQALIAERQALGARAGFDKVILCGTPTSGWEALIPALQAPTEEPPGGSPAAPALSDEDIERFSSRYSEILGAPVITRRIDFAKNNAEQTGFLQMVSNHVGHGDRVQFDITHGLRHLPVVALVAALAIERVKDAKVEAIWYGAFELKDPVTKVTPVVQLGGLLETMRWLDALTVFDATGDMTRFGPLIDKEAGTEIARPLADASFRERVQRTSAVRHTAATVLDAIEDVEDGVSALVRPVIEKRLAWTRNPKQINEGFELALSLAESGNEVRAVTLAFETVVEKIGRAANLPDEASSTDVSGAAGRAAKSTPRGAPAIYAKAFTAFRDLRNNIIHIKEAGTRRTKLPNTSEEFYSELKRLIEPLRRPIPDDFAKLVSKEFHGPTGQWS